MPVSARSRLTALYIVRYTTFPTISCFYNARKAELDLYGETRCSRQRRTPIRRIIGVSCLCNAIVFFASADGTHPVSPGLPIRLHRDRGAKLLESLARLGVYFSPRALRSTGKLQPPHMLSHDAIPDRVTANSVGLRRPSSRSPNSASCRRCVLSRTPGRTRPPDASPTGSHCARTGCTSTEHLCGPRQACRAARLGSAHPVRREREVCARPSMVPAQHGRRRG